MTRFLLALLLGTLAASAQQLSISGTVGDAQGVVRGVSVTLRAPGGATRQASTDDAGKYTFDGLIPGPYEVAFSREGFAGTSRNLSLTSESRTVDVTLSVAGVTSSVDVVDVGGKSTGTRMEISDREIPNQIGVVTAQTLQEQGINDLATALENISGVTTQVQYGVYEWYTIGGITQQSGNDFLFVDGMTMTGNRSATQLNNVEEVQVFKGPSAVMYGGAGASQGGSVNLIMKKPQAIRTQDIQYRVGRFGLQQISGGTAGQVFGLPRLIYRTDASFAYTNGWREAGSNRFNVTPALTWLITDRMRISATQTLTRDRYTLDAGTPVALLSQPGFPLDRRFNPDMDFQATRDWRNQIVFSWNITNRLQLRNSFFKRRNRDQYLDAETLTCVPATNTLNRGELYFQHNRRPVQNQTDLIGDYTLLGMRHRFLLGYDYQDQHNFTDRTGNAPNTSNNLGIPVPPIPIADFLRPGWVDPSPKYTVFPVMRKDFSTNSVNAFAWQDQIDITRRFRINVAGRYDDYKRRTHNDAYNNGALVSIGPDANQKHQTNYAYRAGAVLDITADRTHQVYFSSNSTFEPVFTVAADNRQFEPTKSRSYELGYRWTALRGRLMTNVGARKIINRNILIPLGNQLFDQAGKSSSRVLDFDIMGTLGKGFSTVANYGFADPRYDDFIQAAGGANLAGKRLVHAPKHKSSVWVTKNWTAGENTKITAGLGGRYAFRYFTNAANTLMVPSRLVFIGSVGMSRPRYDITMNVENLTNRERYFVSQINGGNQLYPGAPFTAFVTMRYRFN